MMDMDNVKAQRILVRLLISNSRRPIFALDGDVESAWASLRAAVDHYTVHCRA